MTVIQPTLDLWDEPAPDHRDRVVARSADRVAWLRARSRGITATDVARLSGPASVQAVALDKLHGSSFGGNAYTDHGRAREPEIARWVQDRYQIRPSDALFHAAGQTDHLATPDGVGLAASGLLELAEIKTTKSAWRSIPRSYLRQVWWQQYVLGADRTLLVWEQHDDFVPTNPEPECRWVDRDDNQIYLLVQLANRVLDIVERERERKR
ncbi:YqaJ viral recombinase family protein [Lacisediminihabitans sp.]|uniref:YqaJ viral recombinase family protein n=1 Tax=Lacisediminihabitans sp. TaxID=2787631 RepID=UPI002F95CF31